MDCKIDLAALMREEGLPLYVYADGTVTHKMVPGKIKIGRNKQQGEKATKNNQYCFSHV